MGKKEGDVDESDTPDEKFRRVHMSHLRAADLPSPRLRGEGARRADEGRSMQKIHRMRTFRPTAFAMHALA
jgi:hypothetical protein